MTCERGKFRGRPEIEDCQRERAALVVGGQTALALNTIIVEGGPTSPLLLQRGRNVPLEAKAGRRLWASCGRENRSPLSGQIGPNGWKAAGPERPEELSQLRSQSTVTGSCYFCPGATLLHISRPAFPSAAGDTDDEEFFTQRSFSFLSKSELRAFTLSHCYEIRQRHEKGVSFGQASENYYWISEILKVSLS
jgi:hypothetical protein